MRMKEKGKCCMICHALAASRCRMVRLLVVLSLTAVLVVHKLLSCLPYRATPGAARTSCCVPLVGSLYKSKQSILCHGEAGNNSRTNINSLFRLCVLVFETESTLLTRQERGRQRWESLFLPGSDLCLLLDI